MLAEFALDGEHVGARAQLRVGGGIQIRELRVGLPQECGHDKDEDQHHGRYADLGEHGVDVLEARHEPAMGGLVDEPVKQQRERWQEHRYGDQAEDDSLYQVESEVGANLELHDRERGETEQRRDGARGNRGHRPHGGLHHGFLNVGYGLALRRECV